MRDQAENLKFGSYMVPAGASMAEVLEAITAGGRSTCGRDLNFRIGVTRRDVVLSELDLATNDYVEVVRFDAGAETLPPEYLEVADDPALRVPGDGGRGRDQLADRRSAEEGRLPERARWRRCRRRARLRPDGYEVERGAPNAGR